MTKKTFTRPREFAQAILEEPDVAKQREIFASCPFELRAIVREHVKTVRARATSYREYQKLRQQPIPKEKPPSKIKKASEIGRQYLASIKSQMRGQA